jgi:hypothetical protein
VWKSKILWSFRMMEVYKRTVRGGEIGPELWAPGPPGVGLSHSRIHFHGDSHHDGVTGHISQRTGHSPLTSQHNWCSIYRSPQSQRVWKWHYDRRKSTLLHTPCF